MTGCGLGGLRLGFSVQSSGFGVQGSGFRMQGALADVVVNSVFFFFFITLKPRVE